MLNPRHWRICFVTVVFMMQTSCCAPPSSTPFSHASGGHGEADGGPMGAGGNGGDGGAGDNASSVWANTSQRVSKPAAKVNMVATVERGRLSCGCEGAHSSADPSSRDSTCVVDEEVNAALMSTVSLSTSACALKAKARLSDILRTRREWALQPSRSFFVAWFF